MERRGPWGKGSLLTGPAAHRAGEGSDDLAQLWFLNCLDRLIEGEPLTPPPFALFPLVRHLADGEREDDDLGGDAKSADDLLLISEAAKRVAADLTPDARFLFRLLRGCVMRGHAIVDIALGDDPAPGLAGRHQHD